MKVSRRYLNRPIQMQQAESTEPFFASRQTSEGPESSHPFFTPYAAVQTKLEVNAPGDQYEQEADAMAEKVVQRSAMPSKEEDRIQKMDMPKEEEQVHRKCSSCQEEETNVQRKGDGTSIAPPNVTQQIHNTRGSGTTLPHQTRNEMESSFGTDFSNVRIHDNSQAAEMSDSLHAHAFTHGSDIYFNQGKFAPNNTDGKRLLAHELTHVVQQGGKEIQRSCPQGRNRTVVSDNCQDSLPINPRRYIRSIVVNVARRTVTIRWSSGSPRTESFECTPNPRLTPRGRTTVAFKCGINHTNTNRDRMAYFTAFGSDTGIGFHNSQPVGLRRNSDGTTTPYVSHGCIRVRCPKAELINKHTRSNVTTINVI